MANIDDYYGSGKYLSAPDLKNSVTLPISHWETHTMRDGKVKPVIFFMRCEKALVLNATNKNVLKELYGPDPDLWAGKKIRLIPTETDFAGETVPCIRLRPPSGEAPTAKPSLDNLDDTIPFAWIGALILPWALALLGGGTVA